MEQVEVGEVCPEVSKNGDFEESKKLENERECGRASEDISKEGNDGPMDPIKFPEECGNVTKSNELETVKKELDSFLEPLRKDDNNDTGASVKCEPEIKEKEDPSNEFNDDLFGEDFLESLDVIDSWVDEEGEGNVENKIKEKSDNKYLQKCEKTIDRLYKERGDKSPRNKREILGRQKDKAEGDGSRNRRDIHRERTYQRKDDHHGRRERSTERRQRRESYSKRESGTYKRDSIHRRRGRSMDRRDFLAGLDVIDSWVDEECSQNETKVKSGNGNMKKSGESPVRVRSPRKQTVSEERGSGKRKDDIVLKKNDVKLPKEKNSEKPIKGLAVGEKTKKERTPERKYSSEESNSRNAGREGIHKEKGKELITFERKDQTTDIKSDDKIERNSEFGSSIAKGDTEDHTVMNPAEHKPVEGASIESSNVPKGTLPKKLPLLAPDEPLPPGTEDEYVCAKNVNEFIPDLPPESKNAIIDIVKQEKDDTSCSKTSSTNSNKTSLKSPVLKRKRSPSRSNSADGTRRKLNEHEKTERNEVINQEIRKQREIGTKAELEKKRRRSCDRSFSSRSVRARSQDHDGKSRGHRGRSRECMEKREKSLDRHFEGRSRDCHEGKGRSLDKDLKFSDRYLEKSKNTSSSLSPVMYERFSSPSLSFELSPVSSLSCSPSREDRPKHSRKSHQNSLSPISSCLSYSSLSSDSETERRKHSYEDRPRQRRPPFIKELADILAAKASRVAPQCDYVGGLQNAANYKMQSAASYQPNPFLPEAPYTSPMFQFGKPIPTEGYPTPHVLWVPPFQPEVPPPPINFAFTLPPPPLGAPEPIFQPHIVQIPPGIIGPSQSYGFEVSSRGQPSSAPQNMHVPVNSNQQFPSAPQQPPPPALAESMPYPVKKSLSSMLEASVKVGKHHIGNHRVSMIQRCEEVIKVVKATEQLVDGGCFTFIPPIQNVGQNNFSSERYTHPSPLSNKKNVSFNFTKHPEPKKHTTKARKTMLNIIRSLRVDRTQTISEPRHCRRCFEFSKKTFVESSVQTNDVVLCSVGTQSDFQSVSETNFHGFNTQSKVPSVALCSGDSSRVCDEINDQFSRMARGEPSINPELSSLRTNYASSNILPALNFDRGGTLSQPTFPRRSLSPPRQFPPNSMQNLKSHHLQGNISSNAGLSSYNPRIPGVNIPMHDRSPFGHQASDFLGKSNFNRFTQPSSIPFSEVPHLPPSEIYPPKPTSYKSGDVWSRLGPQNTPGYQHRSDLVTSMPAAPMNQDIPASYRSVPVGMSHEEHQRLFNRSSLDQRQESYASAFKTSIYR